MRVLPRVPLPRPPVRRLLPGRNWLTRLLGPDREGAFQSLAALGVMSITSVIAGLVLGLNEDRLSEFPGLLLLVPGAVALRGNIYGGVGSRLGTAIHAGTYRFSLRSTSVVGQNVIASLLLTLQLSIVMATLGKLFSIVFGVENAISLADFIVISVLGGLVASVVVLVFALLLAAGSVRYDWDPDNVTAPLLTAAGDVVTLPTILLAAGMVDHAGLARGFAIVAAVITVLVSVAVWRLRRPEIRTILLESVPILLLAGLVDLFAGVTVEGQRSAFTTAPSVWVLLPGFLAVAGALGGILSSRLSSKLHLGLFDPQPLPPPAARGDMLATFGLALPAFTLLTVAGQLAAASVDITTPHLARMVLAALLGGVLATVVVVVIAYYGTIVVVRFGFDPDTYGIPMVTSTLDLLGVFVLVLAVRAVGVV